VHDVELAGLETVGAALNVDGNDELDGVEVRQAFAGAVVAAPVVLVANRLEAVGRVRPAVLR